MCECSSGLLRALWALCRGADALKGLLWTAMAHVTMGLQGFFHHTIVWCLDGPKRLQK